MMPHILHVPPPHAGRPNGLWPLDADTGETASSSLAAKFEPDRRVGGTAGNRLVGTSCPELLPQAAQELPALSTIENPCEQDSKGLAFGRRHIGGVGV
jgi:hypothetical protein